MAASIVGFCQTMLEEVYLNPDSKE